METTVRLLFSRFRAMTEANFLPLLWRKQTTKNALPIAALMAPSSPDIVDLASERSCLADLASCVPRLKPVCYR
jgi:hypothetical protein